MVLVQNKKVRTVTLEKVAFLYTLSTNPTPPKNISTIIQLYRPQLRIYRRFDTTYRLTDKFRKKQRQNHQPIPHQHPRPYKRKKHQVPPVLFPTLKQMTSHLMPFRNLHHLRYFLRAFFSGEFAACSEFAAGW